MQLADAVRQIEEAAGKAVKVQPGDGSGLLARPGLSLSYRGRANIHYLALPEGPQMPPFLEALLGLPRGIIGNEPRWVRRLAGHMRPAELLVFTATSCPYCAQAVRAANQVSLVSPQVTTIVIDAQQFPQLAERFSVRSVPQILLDRGLTTTGVVTSSQLVDQILAREDREFQTRVFRSALDAGRFSEAVDQIVHGDGAANFLSTWLESTPSSRMGLMLTAEQCLAEHPKALDQIVVELLPVLRSEDAALRGDTADLLGQIGALPAIQPLQELLEDPNPDVAEIASEALERIQAACRSS